ncbi:hypothetical protein I6A60_36380 [Frankia sp. AgB1.9]|uniref:hypothetical protein n=1 Tax=unclassified Frankia TaxID=2632575 RepID=UPI00193348DF|nr:MULTISPECIES: hypothetical protein [unclassified Frankia]MBL7490267.1 hypothetical protein [Frankia sp. AgW1.1]MBL7553292.1 hypothetical protein [Frankia sp. AgB1.9]MBL7624765.1 hypothetical protein [Frankia sp. AgB1.8]
MQIMAVGPQAGGLIAIGAQATGILAIGQSATGVLAIGQLATGVVAIGQVATGVVAIGQLARGGLVVGQLALGLVSFGMLSIGVCWSAGLVGIGAFSGPGFIVSLFGRLVLRRLPGRAIGLPQVTGQRPSGGANPKVTPGGAIELADASRAPRLVTAASLTPRRLAVGVAVSVAIAVVWWFGAGASLVDALTPGASKGVSIEAPQEG